MLTTLKLRKILTHLWENESGQGALAIVLLLLMLGAVILTPLLVFMSTGVKSGQVYESKLQEFYAADAGIEHAIWRIMDGNFSVLYSLGEEVNDRNVTVAIEDKGGWIYLINSTATSDDGGSTTIETYVSMAFMDFSGLLNNAITSGNEVEIGSNTHVSGNISLPLNGTLTPPDYEPENGTVKREELDWPTADQLSAFYADDVAGHDFPYDSIDVKDYSSIGPLYRDGSLSVDNTGSSGTLQLNGTVYVTEDLTFEQVGGPKSYTLDLNGQTIYAEGTIEFPAQFVSLAGPGCIIAKGDVNFQPEETGYDFIFVMSIEGYVWFKPGGSFQGSLAGDVRVDLQPNFDLEWLPPPSDLNFPMGDDTGIGGANVSVLSYQVK